jgi:hypothetical protein
LERPRRPRPQRVNSLASSISCLETSGPIKNLIRSLTNYYAGRKCPNKSGYDPPIGRRVVRASRFTFPEAASTCWANFSNNGSIHTVSDRFHRCVPVGPLVRSWARCGSTTPEQLRQERLQKSALTRLQKQAASLGYTLLPTALLPA